MFEKLGKFEIKRVLGSGAMGEVYLGVDPTIGREVAIKTILPAAAQGGEAKERFAREARAAGVLNHPNLVTIYEFGEDQGVLYIAMEFVRGHDLDELLQEQSLTRSETLEILAQACDGLGFAHRQHIVHRDIKPANIRVQRDGRRLLAKVMDFGVAKISNADMTATGMVMGTVSYMAPEYIRTGKPDPRSDLFAVGVMLYECLSGRKPFAGETTPTVLYKIVNEAPDPIETEDLRGISPAIRSVLERTLCKNPEGRFQTAEGLAAALRAAKDPSWSGQLEETTAILQAAAPTLPISVPPPIQGPTPLTPSPAPGFRPGLRGRGLWLGLAALLLVGLGGAAWRARKDRGSAPLSSPSLAKAGTTPPVQPLGAPSGPAQPQAGPSASAPGDPPSPRPDPKAGADLQPVRPPRPKTVEAKAIDQPDLYRPEQLDKLQVHERLNLGNLSLSEAIQLADSQPERAIHGLRQALKADPTNVNAHAWLAAVLFQQGRETEFVRELREARHLGILGQMAARNVRFRSALSQARLNRKLPSDLVD